MLEEILSGKSDVLKALKGAKYPMIIVGDAALVRSDGFAALSLVHEIAKKRNIVRDDWNGINILHNHASMVGALDIGFIYGKDGDGTAKILEMTKTGRVKILYLLGADDLDISKISKDCFVVYQGHHGDVAAARADVILPEAAYTEQDGIFVNLEGLPQYARAAVDPVGQAKESWDIISCLSKNLNIDLGVNSLADVRKLMAKENAVFANIDKIIRADFVQFKSSTNLTEKPLTKVTFNYYMSDQISRSSVTMARCTKAAITTQEEAI